MEATVTPDRGRALPPSSWGVLALAPAPAVADTGRLAVESPCFQGKDRRADLAFDRAHHCCDSPTCLPIPGTLL